jgi:Mlc titration factor MtfA (ptsG expression regulator)
MLFVTDHIGLQLLIFLGIVIFLVALTAPFFRALYRLNDLLSRRYFVKADLAADEKIRSHLAKVNYFRNLSEPGKLRFIYRLRRILKRLQFSTEGNIEADEEKQVLIAASAVQITFGLEEYDIDTIERIKVFADDIFNTKTKVRYKGLTFMNGNMFLSWKHFVEGIRVQDDGINLGLHETAHGLYIMLQQYRGYENLDDILRVWYDYAWDEIDHRNTGTKEFFRKYADANIQEFFAICIENFFERPAEFSRRLPLIYGQLCAFLNQDPSNLNDYAFVPAQVAAAGPPSERLYLYKNRPHPSQGLLMWASGICVVAMILLKAYLLETLFNLLLYSIPCMFISWNLFKRFYLHSKRMTRRWYFFFCFTCINPIVFTCFLLVNLAISSGVSDSRVYEVTGTDHYFLGVNQNDLALTEPSAVYLLRDNYTVPIDQRRRTDANAGALSVEYRFHYGITGFKVVDEVIFHRE